MAADIKARASVSDKLAVGDPVRIENHISGLWDKTGTVAAVREHGKLHIITNDDGRNPMLRNRRHVKRLEASEVNRMAGGNGVGAAAGGLNAVDRGRLESLEKMIAVNKTLMNPSKTQDYPSRNTRSHGSSNCNIY